MKAITTSQQPASPDPALVAPTTSPVAAQAGPKTTAHRPRRARRTTKCAAPPQTKDNATKPRPPELPKLEYWRGETLPGGVIGLAVEVDDEHDGTQPQLSHIAISDGLNVRLVEPDRLKHFLVEHAACWLIFFDGPRVAPLLAKMFQNCEGITIEQLGKLREHLLDLSSLLTAIRDAQHKTGLPEQAGADLPPEIIWDLFVELVLRTLPEENPGRSMLQVMFQQAQHDPHPEHLDLATTATAIAQSLLLVFLTVKHTADAADRFEKYVNQVFAQVDKILDAQVYLKRQLADIKDPKGHSCPPRPGCRPAAPPQGPAPTAPSVG